MTQRVTVYPKDFLGTTIQVGDTVVYSVKTESSGLRKGTVLALVPFDRDGYVENPFFDPNGPVTHADYRTGQPGINDRHLVQPQTQFKIKLTTTQNRYNALTRSYEDYDTTKTLDDPSRFVVIK